MYKQKTSKTHKLKGLYAFNGNANAIASAHTGFF
jgi:hypothetical protein